MKLSLTDSVQPYPALCPSRRLRRRGPRTQHAVLRRSVPKQRRTMPGMSPGELGEIMSVSSRIQEPLTCKSNTHNGVYILAQAVNRQPGHRLGDS